jgi:hypothetical protein
LTEAIIIAVLGSGVLSTIISGIFSIIRDRKTKKLRNDREYECIRDGLQQLMYDRIKYLCKSHISRGYIFSNDLEDLVRMHKIYHDRLNGNGFCDDLMEAVSHLPIKPALPKEV